MKRPSDVLSEEFEKLLVLEEVSSQLTKEQNELIQTYCDDVCEAVRELQRRWKSLLNRPR